MSMGGAQRSLFKLSHELRKYYTVTIVVFNRNYIEAAALTEKVYSLDVQSGKSPWKKMKAFFWRVQKLKSLKTHLKVDVSISFLEGADYINILSRRNEKVILSIRGSKVHDENMRKKNMDLRRYLIRKLYRKADTIVCVNHGIADEMKNFYHIDQVPLPVIHNFYDIEDIQQLSLKPLPTEICTLFKNETLVMSGRLASEKGNLFVLEVFAELQKVRPGLRLVFIGDGPLKQEIVDRCESLGLNLAYQIIENASSTDVFITGDQKNVFNFLKASSLYILNSSSEGFPNGLAEAMACGIPVLSSDCPYGPGEILRSFSAPFGNSDQADYAEYGILLPVNTRLSKPNLIQEWKRVITKMLDSSELRNKYSVAGLKRIQDFEPAPVIEKWRKIIDN